MSDTRSCRAFAPGSVSNLACGFDVLGFAIEEPGDEVVATLRDQPGVELLSVTGDDGRLPRDPARNTASVAAMALLESADCSRGIGLSLHKKMPLSSGLGSSAASGVAALHATNHLLGLGASREELLRCAMAAEKMACGSAHADNATPSLYGGLVLIRGTDPPDVVELPVPEGLACAVVRPHIEIETRSARGLLGETVRLRDAVVQWGNLAAFIAGLYRADVELIARSLVDVVAEPKRAALIPGFHEVKRAALEGGALGCSLSGSGPSIFALCASAANAECVADSMVNAFAEKGLQADRHVSRVGAEGVRLLPDSNRRAQ